MNNQFDTADLGCALILVAFGLFIFLVLAGIALLT